MHTYFDHVFGTTEPDFKPRRDVRYFDDSGELHEGWVDATKHIGRDTVDLVRDASSGERQWRNRSTLVAGTFA